MTEEEKKAIDTLTIIASTSKVDCEDYPNCICMKKDLILALNLIQSRQKEIEKKDNIIDLISEKLAKVYHYKFKECSLKEKEQNNIDCDKYKDCTSCVKQYFKKVEGKQC